MLEYGQQRLSSGCPAGYFTQSGQYGDYCVPVGSPVIFDLDGNGFSLTSGGDGVRFDLDADGVKELTAWTALGSRDAWLVLDRNRNGKIDDGTELFGNFTPQESSDSHNGFTALAAFDSPDLGGDGDGWITDADRVYGALRLWVDHDHDGKAKPAELISLSATGVTAIGLRFREKSWTDTHGNWFRYESRAKVAPGSSAGKRIFDVYLVSGTRQISDD